MGIVDGEEGEGMGDDGRLFWIMLLVGRDSWKISCQLLSMSWRLQSFSVCLWKDFSYKMKEPLIFRVVHDMVTNFVLLCF